MNLLDRLGAKLSDPSRMRVYPVMLAAVPLLAWGVSLASRRGLVDSSGNLIGADFVEFYMAGTFARTGRIDALASLFEQRQFQEAVAAPIPLEGFTPWLNPPFFAYVFAPLSALPYMVALACFWVLGLATFIITLSFARRLLGLVPSRGRLFVLAASYFPTMAWFMFGQTSAWSLALMTASVAGLLSGRDLLAGLLLGCFAYKPQLAVGIGTALILARRWRAVLGAFASGLGLFGLSYLLIPSATRAWILGTFGLLTFNRQVDHRIWGQASFFEASVLLLDSVSHALAGLVSGLLTAAAVVGLAALWRRVPWRPEHPSFRLALAATLAVSLLVSPHLYFYDLMLMLLPGALVLSVLPSLPVTSPDDPTPILSATAWVYFLGLTSPYLALAQVGLTTKLTGAPVALQLETIAIAVWGWRVGRRAIAVA